MTGNSKRTVLHRERQPTFDREVVELFLRLEGMPQDTQEFKDGSKELALRLDLASEWWTCNHVNDSDVTPCWPEGHYATTCWHRCRAVRRRLIAAAKALNSASADTRGGIG